jgi:hypothetical protein
VLSKSLSHYPQIRFRDGRKWLWNPILKKAFAVRPEERVRLSLVDYLLLEAAVPTSRMAFESPVKLTQDDNKVRTDIICYDQDFTPKLLVECKAPEIKLDEKAAIQIARYNQKVNAPYLLISNGWLDFWFKNVAGSIKDLGEIPESFQSNNDLPRTYNYWEERGFVGEKLPTSARTFSVESCQQLFTVPAQPVKYLQFDGFSPEFALSHYYRIFGLPDNTKIALSLAANPYSGTRLNAVLNQKGANTAFFSASLDLIVEGVKSNTEIHSSQGVQEVDLRIKTKFTFEQSLPELVPDIRDLLLKYS